MTTEDFKAFCVICLMGIAAMLLIFYQWHGYILMLGDITFMALIMLSVSGTIVLVVLLFGSLYYKLAMKQTQLESERARIEQSWADLELRRMEALSKGQLAIPIAPGHSLYTNQPLTALQAPNLPSQPMAALPMPSEPQIEVDPERLFATFRKAKAIHGLIIGSRNSGKSTLVNRLMNVEFTDYDTVIIDPLFNQIDSGWLLHGKVKINRNFVQGLTEFYKSHKAVADTTNTSRKGSIKRLLIIDEFPSLLADLEAKDKQTYKMVMAMLRSIYSQGSHTNHNLMLLSQTVLSEDIGLSSNDKANFIQVCLGSLGGDYLSLRRGKANKKTLYMRLDDVSNDYEYYVTFEDNKGQIDVQPLPDLAQFGAKRLYGLDAESVFGDENEGINQIPSTQTDTAKLPDNWQQIAEWLQLGMSANAIYDKIRGNRNDTLGHIRTVKTYLEHQATGQTNGYHQVVTL